MSSARNFRATSASSSRSRFFVNTVGTHTNTPDQTQRVLRRNPLLKVHKGKQFTRSLVRTAHLRTPSDSEHLYRLIPSSRSE
jgi:hypothetical protein